MILVSCETVSFFLQVDDKDFVDVNIIAFRRMNQMDVSGYVKADPLHVGSIKVGNHDIDSTL